MYFFAAIYIMCNIKSSQQYCYELLVICILFYAVMFVQRTERYSTVEKDCLAIKLAVQAFKVNLLDSLKENNAWWSLSLQPYVYSVCHRTGKANGNADALSHAKLV